QFLTYHAEPTEGTELEKATYSINKRQKILRLVCQWLALYGRLLQDEQTVSNFLEKLSDAISKDARLCSTLKEQLQDRKRTRILEPCGNCTPQSKQVRNSFNWFNNLEEDFVNTQPIKPQDTVVYKIFKPDHSYVSALLSINASVKEVISSLVDKLHSSGEHILLKVNSAGKKTELKPEATAVSSSLAVNERLFLCTAHQINTLTPHPEQLGPATGTMETLQPISSKDIANQLTDPDWDLFNCIHEVELVYYILGRHVFGNITTANLERFVCRFNEIQFWVVTEIVLCSDLNKRVTLLKKFIKVATILKEQKNLNSFFAIMFGLSNSAVSRLSKTWERLPNKTRKLYSGFERLMDPSKNHRAYRLAITKLSPPIIPFIPLLLKDMTFVHDGNKTYLENLVNFEKMRMIATTVRIIQHCRSQPYSEQSQSIKNLVSIQAYFQQLKVIDQQKTLTQHSREIE
uniref:Rap guanine nucleotide exchange factor 3 n=1 Tax=Latimeria chalumnae TaxID=7897 RepID=H3BIN0_LATCH